jgi:hypothetical protein
MSNTLRSPLTSGISVTRYAGPVDKSVQWGDPDRPIVTRTRYQINTPEKYIDLSADQAICLIILLTKQLTQYRKCDCCETTD